MRFEVRDIGKTRHLLGVGLGFDIWDRLVGAVAGRFDFYSLRRLRGRFFLEAGFAGVDACLASLVLSLSLRGVYALHLVSEAVVAHAGGVAVGDFELRCD
jgi:hypothetical protein